MPHPTLAPATRPLRDDPADRPPTAPAASAASGAAATAAPPSAARSIGRALARHPLAVAAVPAGSAWMAVLAGMGELAHPAATAIAVAVAVTVLAWSESRIGILRTLVVACLGSLAPVAVAALLLGVGLALGDFYSQMDAADRLWAPSVVIVAVAAAASRGLAPAHRDGLRAAVLAAVLAGLLAGGHGVDLTRGVALVIGLGLGRLLVPLSARPAWQDAQASSARVVAATVLGTVTLSWWIAAVSGDAVGVLSMMGTLLDPGATVGVLGALIVAVALLLRGRRLGFVIGVAALLLITGLLAWYYTVIPLTEDWFTWSATTWTEVEWPVLMLSTWLVPAVALVVILARRRSFTKRAVAEERSAGRERVLAQLMRSDAGSLGFMGTWSGSSHWFAADEGDPSARGAVAYRAAHGVALTVSDPIASAADASATIRGFARHCSARGLVPAFYSIHSRDLPVFAELGWSVTPVAEEAVIDLAGFSTSGKRRQDLRTAANRAARDGVDAVWSTYRGLPEPLRRAVDALSGDWADAKALPEMGFTLGGLRELDDPEVRMLLAVDAAGRVHGVTSWLPAYRDGRLVGRTLDVMRRGTDPMPGVMEFLIATAARAFQEEGLESLSLSGTPLAGIGSTAARGPVDRVIARLLAATGRVLEPSYGFTSLLRFKAKFDPRYETLWLACPSPADLAPIGRALTTAYVPTLRLRQLVGALRAAGAQRAGARREARAARRAAGRAARRASLSPADDSRAQTGAGVGSRGEGRPA
ncbi:bifunctional lysylphosphatidylglycerol flippase/synthetase MprF [Clavibacter zhangzhiyongii]|uniref:bifunctional lysylphosphatidylglycerol flippase/synthetase MprF n=1 Tax=Clavibacter zhangzhiyongii TaxID=2768071 RepID=UPI0039E1AF24